MSDGALNAASAAPMVRLRARMFQSGTARRRIVLGIRALTIAAIAVFALTTPGFTSPLSINALLNAISFIGCVAVGMTFITLTGNIMSLCLGATLSASALVFLASLSAGILPAFLITRIPAKMSE
jgi:ribose/xylose/arabinose/galactoside ABC-type transport system permease subunit